MYTKFNDFLLNEAAFSKHYKGAGNSRFDLRIKNLDLDLALENGNDFPVALYDVAQERCRQVLAYLGTTVLDAADIPDKTDGLEAIRFIFPEIVLKSATYPGKMWPQFITGTGDGKSNPPGNVFSATMLRIGKGPFEVTSIFCRPRNVPNGLQGQPNKVIAKDKLMLFDLDRERVEAGQAPSEARYESKDRRLVVIDLDMPQVEFDAAWPKTNYHFRDNLHLDDSQEAAALRTEVARRAALKPKEREAEDEALAAAAAAAAATQKQADRDEADRVAREKILTDPNETKLGRQMGLQLAGENSTFMFADWEGDQVVAREYKVVAFNVLKAGAAKAVSFVPVPHARFAAGDVLVVQAAGVATGKTKFCRFEIGGRQYIISNKKGTFIDSIGQISQERDKTPNLILMASKLHGQSTSRKYKDGDVVTGIKMPPRP